jgi:hypothetical protein
VKEQVELLAALYAPFLNQVGHRSGQ